MKQWIGRNWRDVRRTAATWILTGLIMLGVGGTRAAGADPWTKITRPALAKMAAQGRAVVVVKLTGAQAQPAAPDRRAIAAEQQGVLDALRAETGWRLRHRFSTIPYLVGEVDYSALGALAADARVAEIAVEEPVVQPADIDSNNQIGATLARYDFGLTGSGVNVGIVDTGIDLAHPDLQGAFVAGRRIMDQGTLVDGNVQDDQGHGSHVAGIIAGQGLGVVRGVAPEAGLVVVKALGPLGGYPSDVAAGIDWIVANNATLASPVRFINLSLQVGGDLPAHCPCDTFTAYPELTAAIEAAYTAGVYCVAAAGNDGDTVLRYPACLSKVISVGATFDLPYPCAPALAADFPTTCTFYQDGGATFAFCNHTEPVVADQLACFSNRSACMSFVAPGYTITSVMAGETTQTLTSYGTSQATAHVTGALALLQEATPTSTTAQLVELLHENSVPIPLNISQPTGLQVDRIDVSRAGAPFMRNAMRDWRKYR